jgi:hypothetical protein
MSIGARKRTAGGLALRAALVLAGLAAAYAVAAPLFEIGGVKAPAVQRAGLVRADQGWDRKEADRYHHSSQGTRILPLAWFLALEQPVFTPLPVGRLAARDYLGRFGFNYEEGGPKPGAPDLPVGFAVQDGFVAAYARPPVPSPTPVVGLTCAACHTGRIDVKRGDGTVKAVLVEGGSAMINLALFQDATERALFFTKLLPMRFQRFADRVLGDDPSDRKARKARLEQEVDAYITFGLTSKDYAKEHKLNPVELGFSRTDALGLIGNRVFGVLSEENQIVTDAPVNFPHLWDTPWFDWVQYNASIRTPMARNIGEALGVGALVNLTDPAAGLYESTVNAENLAWMEDLLGGDEPFQGLQPPRWADVMTAGLGGPAPARSDYAIKPGRAAAGRELYRHHCERCHLPPRDEMKAAYARGKPGPYFAPPDPGSGKRFLKVKLIDLNVIGTDPNQALNFYRRVAVAPEPVLKHQERGGYPYWSDEVKDGYPGTNRWATISAEDGLFRVTSLVRRRQYESKAFGLLAPADLLGDKERKAFNDDPKRRARRMRFDRFRSVPEALDFGETAAIIGGEAKDQVIMANLGYKARPLDGVWATPPFLHNGSVPNLYQMLVPVADRSARFYLGSTRFDPKHVGYETSQFTGAFELDTSLPGNHNTGHEFRNLTLEELEPTPWDGRSTREERWAAVLGVDVKTLGGMPAKERWERTREASRLAMAKPMSRPLKGVLGPEFTDEERWQLVEFLKTL